MTRKRRVLRQSGGENTEERACRLARAAMGYRLGRTVLPPCLEELEEFWVAGYLAAVADMVEVER